MPPEQNTSSLYRIVHLSDEAQRRIREATEKGGQQGRVHETGTQMIYAQRRIERGLKRARNRQQMPPARDVDLYLFLKPGKPTGR